MTIETILGTTTGVRAAAAPMTAGAGQSFILRDQSPGSKCRLLDVFSQFAVASTVSIRSPRMHDNVRGIFFPTSAAAQGQYLLNGIAQPMMPQDNIQVVAGIGGGVATFDNVAFSIFYENLIGAEGDLREFDSIKDLIKNIMVCNVLPTIPATGDWSPGIAINSTIDLFKANTNYAILGFSSSTSFGMAAVSGPCTGNVLCGHLLDVDCNLDITHYFAKQSRDLGLATIPIMKSADKNGTFIYLADASVAATDCDVILAELGGY
jgi:hypothetical protein